MTASPLVPVPELPYETSRVHEGSKGRVRVSASKVSRDPYGFVMDVMAGDSIDAGIGVKVAEAPALAAAILAAAGCDTHRVIDLGGPMPKVIRHEGRGETVGYGSEPDGLISDAQHLKDIRAQLALLEARAAIPKHDPAEVVAARAARSAYWRSIGQPDRADAEPGADSLSGWIAAVRAAR